MVTLLAALTLAGCGGAGENDSAASGSAGRPAQAPAREGRPGEAGVAADVGGGAKPEQRQVKLDPATGERVVAYTATLAVRAKSVDESGTRAKQLVTAAGGYVESELAAADSGRVSLTFKIPADRYAATLDQLTSQLGRKLSLRQEAEDLTEEVADTDSRVRSAQASLASFRKLLDRARTVGEVVNVERELSTRQAELESLLARQKALSERTRYATVTVELTSPAKPAAPLEEERTGFLGGLQTGWEAFTAFISGLLLVLGASLPFLLAAAVIVVPAIYVRRRIMAGRPAPGGPAPATPAPPAE